MIFYSHETKNKLNYMNSRTEKQNTFGIIISTWLLNAGKCMQSIHFSQQQWKFDGLFAFYLFSLRKHHLIKPYIMRKKTSLISINCYCFNPPETKSLKLILFFFFADRKELFNGCKKIFQNEWIPTECQSKHIDCYPSYLILYKFTFFIIKITWKKSI